MGHHEEPLTDSNIEQKFFSLLERLAIKDELRHYLDSVYLPVAEWIASQPRPFVVGINGAQGSGKSTLSEILALLLSHKYRLKVATLSIDDLYKSRSERTQMSENTHPLFITRGVPGTHNIKLGCKTLQSLLADETTAIPRFDKLTDNPLPRSQWPSFEGAADIVIFEGWCIGAIAQHEEQLFPPVNQLEADEDMGGEWRQYVNRQLQSEYTELFEFIDALIMLEIPDFEKVIEWRSLQESKMSKGEENRGMNAAELERFIMHFERLTRHMLEEMPKRADILLSLNHQHQIDTVKIR